MVVRSQRTKYASSGFVAEQRAVAPLHEEEVLDGWRMFAQSRSLFGSNTAHCVRLVDRVLEEDEQPPDVDVLPLGIGAHRPRAPDPVAAAVEEAQRVDALGVEHVLAALVDVRLEAGQALDDLVRRRLEDAAL